MKNTTGLRPEIHIVVEIGCTFFLDATEVNYVLLSKDLGPCKKILATLYQPFSGSLYRDRLKSWYVVW